MINKNKLFITLILITTQVSAYVPSIESLFRSGSLKNIDTRTIVLEIKSEKITKEGEEPGKKIFYKYIFNTEKKNRVFGLQLGYSNAFKKENLQHIKFWPSFHHKTLRGLSAEQKILYSILSSQGLKNGDMLLHYLRERGSQVKFNKEILNKEQKLLLEKYMYYLSIVNQKTEVEIVKIKNPLESEDPEVQEKIKETLRASFYKQSPLIKYFRDGKDLKWKVGDVFEAIFDYEGHQLEKITIPIMETSIQVDLRSPILFKGKYEIASHMYFKLQNGDKYHIEVLNYYRMSEDRPSYLKRVQRYQKTLEENKTKLTTPFPFQPLFI